MLDRFHLPRAGPVLAVVALALVLVPSAASGNYTDPSGDAFGGAGDITAVTVAGDKGTGQIMFRITGNNIASSADNVLFVDIDSDANPNTGNLADDGAEFSFYVDNDSFDFARWDGAHWADTPYSTVHVSGGTSQIIISVNRSELGNTTDFNFTATAFNAVVSGSTAQIGLDAAPDDGAFNYSIESNGPQIKSVDVQTTPAAGPRAGKSFVVVPTALHLPPDARTTAATFVPESYSCTAKLGAKKLVGTGTGSCTFSIPKKKSRGKSLKVTVTVVYEGATKSFDYAFRVR